MKFLYQKVYSSKRTLILLVLVIIGLLTSRALISIATIALFVNVLIDGQFQKTVQNLFGQKKVLLLIGLLLMILLSFWGASSFQSWSREFTIKLPFLVFPIAILHWKNFSKKNRDAVLACFVLLMVYSGVIVLSNYFLHLDYYTNSLREAQAIPTPHNHVRYSLMLALSTIVSLHFWIKKRYFFFVQEKYLWASFFVFCFILIHILSVRSGMVTLYLALLFYLFHYILVAKNKVLGFILVAILFLSPVVAYKTIPSIQHKISYMQYDFEQFRQGNIGANSDGNRLRSLQVGWAIAQENICTGIGVGNLENAVHQYYEKHFPTVDPYYQKMPHNQFLWTLIELGVIGLFVFLVVIFYPVFTTNWLKNPLFICFSIIYITSFLVEATLEMQLGITCFALFSPLLLRKTTHE